MDYENGFVPKSVPVVLPAAPSNCASPAEYAKEIFPFSSLGHIQMLTIRKIARRVAAQRVCGTSTWMNGMRSLGASNIDGLGTSVMGPDSDKTDEVVVGKHPYLDFHLEDGT